LKYSLSIFEIVSFDVINICRFANHGYIAMHVLLPLSNNARALIKLCRFDGGDMIEYFSVLSENMDDINKLL
jgi:hypothetical protein